MKLPLDDRQIELCNHAAKVEDSFADCGEADRHLIDELLEAGFLYKTKSRKIPYEFTQAGCLAVALWNAHQAAVVPPLARDAGRPDDVSDFIGINTADTPLAREGDGARNAAMEEAAAWVEGLRLQPGCKNAPKFAAAIRGALIRTASQNALPRVPPVEATEGLARTQAATSAPCEPSCVCEHDRETHDGPGSACGKCNCMYFEPVASASHDSLVKLIHSCFHDFDHDALGSANVIRLSREISDRIRALSNPKETDDG